MWCVNEVRKEARAGEIDAIKKAKAVLSGADYSLLQVRISGLCENLDEHLPTPNPNR